MRLGHTAAVPSRNVELALVHGIDCDVQGWGEGCLRNKRRVCCLASGGQRIRVGTETQQGLHNVDRWLMRCLVQHAPAAWRRIVDAVRRDAHNAEDLAPVPLLRLAHGFAGRLNLRSNIKVLRSRSAKNTPTTNNNIKYYKGRKLLNRRAPSKVN